MGRIFTRIKQLIAAAKLKFRRQNVLVTDALKSATPGTALRAAMHDNEGNPEVLDELLKASRDNNLGGRP